MRFDRFDSNFNDSIQETRDLNRTEISKSWLKLNAHSHYSIATQSDLIFKCRTGLGESCLKWNGFKKCAILHKLNNKVCIFDMHVVE